MTRPWGKMWKLLHLPFMWVKFIAVTGRTSLQHHNNRDEYLIGITVVPRGMRHRLYRGYYLELALGRPDEDDIVRHEDDYGRT